MSRTHNAGIVTAYGAAVRGGYTGTYEEFCAQQAQYAENARQMEQAVSDVRQIKTSVESAVSEAEGYANNANQSATNASNSATQASESASNANQSANNASSSADSASQSASSAQTSANNASTSEQNARQSAEDAHQSVEDAQDILESVQTEGNTQIGRVQAKGNEIIDSLPDDFTEIQNELNALNGSLDTLKEDLTNLNLITLSGIKAIKGYPLGSKTWGNINSLYQHKVLPVQGGEKIIIEAKNLPSGYRLYYGALTSYTTPTVNDPVNYSANSDWTDRRGIDKPYTIVDTIPNDARYIFVQTVFSGVATEPSKFEINGYDYAKSSAVGALTASVKDLVPIEWVQGTMNASTGENASMTTRLRSSNTFYDVSRGIKFTIPSGYKFEIFYYTSASGGYLTYHDFDTSEEIYVYPRIEAKYCRFVCATTDNAIITDTPVYGEYISDGKLPVWYALGDSITQGYFSYLNASNVASYKTFADGYVSHIAYKSNLGLVNCGIGGSGYVRSGSALSQYNARQMVDSINFSSVDLVTLAYGINDWKYNQTLGTFDDDVETGGTIYSNMRYCVEKILSDNPACKIVIISPFNCSAFGTQDNNWCIGHSFSNNGTLEDIYTAEKTVAAYYGIEILDTLHESVINRISAPSLLIDGVHPSAKCHAILGAELAKKINYI